MPAVTYDGVITDLNRYATLYSDEIWRKHYGRKAELRHLIKRLQRMEDEEWIAMTDRESQI